MIKKARSVLVMGALAMALAACGGKGEASESTGAASDSKIAESDGAEEQNTSADGQEISSDSQEASAGKGEATGGTGAYPAEIGQWTARDYIDYFTEAGVFYDGNGAETWIQDHATYWGDTPVDECAGWWTDDDTSLAMVFIMNADNADTSEEQLEEWKNTIMDTKALPGDYAFVPVDHMVGNVGFSYSTILDEEAYKAMDDAYEELIHSLGVTPEF